MAGYGATGAGGMGGIQAQADLAMMRAQNPELSKARRGLAPNDTTKTRAAMEDTSKEFEAMFIGQMLKPMFDSLPTDGVTGGGSAEKVWRSLLVTEYGKSVAQQGGIGIADHVLREMIRLQEDTQ